MSKLLPPSEEESSALTHNFEVRGSYAYYDRNEVDDRPNYYHYLLSKAKISILIWDPYFMETVDPALFEYVKKNGIDIELLTWCNKKRNQDGDNVDAFLDNLEDVFKRVKVKKYNVVVNCFRKHPRTADRNKDELYMWHDRYLIIDGSDTYLVGPSMNNLVNFDQSFGVYHVEDEEAKSLIFDKFQKYRRLLKDNVNGWKKTRHKP